jgi:hypothetical protein
MNFNPTTKENNMQTARSDFHVATDSLPMTNTDTHALVARGGYNNTLTRLYSFRNFDLALAAYEAAVEHAMNNGMSENEARDLYAVRSMDDPQVRAWGTPVEQYVPFMVVAGAMRRNLRAEVNETVKWALRTVERVGYGSLAAVEADVKRSLTERGFNVERWQVEDAVKARVVLGRCREHGNGRSAYFFLKRTKARLAETRCPHCGSRLAQTTLALDSKFEYLADPVGTYFSNSLDLLPGETQADAEARHDRVHAAMDAQA